jgi:YVTN family beta-propeller protein
MGRRLALVIASYTYQDPGLRQLRSPAHDAESLAAVLRDPQIAGFEVTALINEPHHVAGEAIGDFYRDRRRDDLTLLYFTGHGLKDDQGRLFLAMTNTRRDALLFTALSAEQIDQAIDGCASRQKVLILDCCYSGAFPAGRLAKGDPDVHSLERFGGRGRTVLTASDSTQYSFEGDQLHGEAAQSVFTRYLVEGLRDGSADLDGDGDITVDELYQYAHERVVDEMPQQRPKKQDDVEGRIVIAQNIRWSLPVHLRSAINSPFASDRVGVLDGLVHLHRVGNSRVRALVVEEIQRLVDDDSKQVSAEASARLRSLAAEPLESPRTHIQPPASQVEAVEPSTPPAAVDPAVSARRSSTQAEPRAGMPGRIVQALLRLARPAAGVLAVVAGGLLTTGLAVWHESSLPSVSPYSEFFGFPKTAGEILVAYTAGMAALAVIAGVLTLLPWTRSLIGPGLIIGAGGASTWGLAFVVGDYSFDQDSGAYWVAPVGHMILLLAGLATGFATWMDPVARQRANPPSRRVRRAVFVLAMLGMLALLVQLVEVAAAKRVDWPLRVWAGPYLVTAVLALALPAVAVTTSRRLGLAILAGWITGGAAIIASSLVLAWDNESLAGAGVIGFACTLLILLAAAGAWLRGGDPGPTPAWRWRSRTNAFAALLLVAVTIAAGSAILVRYNEKPALFTAVASSPDGQRLYALEDVIAAGETRMWTIDVATNRAIGKPIVLGNGWQASDRIALNPQGDRAYITRRGTDTVRVVDTERNAIVGNPIPVGKRPSDVAVAPDGRHAYVSNTDSGTVSVIDTATNKTVGQPIPVGEAPRQLAVSPDGKRVYVADSGSDQVSVIDTATKNTIGQPIAVANHPQGLTLSADGQRLYITTGGIWNFTDEGVTVVDTATSRILGQPFDVSISSNGKAARIVGWSGIAVSPDGSHAYVTDGWSNAVVAIDLSEGHVIPRAIKVGSNALGITHSPNGRFLYAATAQGISVIDAPAYESTLIPFFV